jgi:hypothetical protein
VSRQRPRSPAEPYAGAVTAPRRPRERDDRTLDRLADSGPSRVGVDAAMRIRDVSRPSADDLAAAEAAVVIRRARKVDP